MNYGVRPEQLPEVGLSYPTGPPMLPPLSTIVTRALGQPLERVVELSNDPRFLTAIVPSANVVTSANELSRFFEIFRRGGELDGVRVIGPRALRRALTEQSHLEIDLSLLFPTRFSYGMMLGAQLISLYGRDTQAAFGHLGLINIMGWADPERGISGAPGDQRQAGPLPGAAALLRDHAGDRLPPPEARAGAAGGAVRERSPALAALRTCCVSATPWVRVD